MGRITVSSIGQADDTVLISNSINDIFYLLALTNIFSSKYLVNLSAEKTKLQVFHAADDYKNANNPLKINGATISFVDEMWELSGQSVGMVLLY